MTNQTKLPCLSARLFEPMQMFVKQQTSSITRWISAIGVGMAVEAVAMFDAVSDAASISAVSTASTAFPSVPLMLSTSKQTLYSEQLVQLPCCASSAGAADG